jgi:hypothetical protein
VAFLVAGLALGLGACAGGPSVRTDYQPSTDFSAYHTFAIRPGRIVGEAGVVDPAGASLTRQHIDDSLRADLRAKGLTESDASPDIYVTYVAGAHTRQEWEDLGPTAYADYGFYWRHGPWPLGYDNWWVEHDVTHGTLVIDLVDAKTKQTVWRAFAEEDIERPVSAETIQTAVSKALEDYPPKAQQ